MKLEIDKHTNLPKITFTHYDKSIDLHQQALGVFIKLARENGISVVGTHGILSDSESYNNYEIIINETTKRN